MLCLLAPQLHRQVANEQMHAVAHVCLRVWLRRWRQRRRCLQDAHTTQAAQDVHSVLLLLCTRVCAVQHGCSSGSCECGCEQRQARSGFPLLRAEVWVSQNPDTRRADSLAAAPVAVLPSSPRASSVRGPMPPRPALLASLIASYARHGQR